MDTYVLSRRNVVICFDVFETKEENPVSRESQLSEDRMGISSLNFSSFRACRLCKKEGPTVQTGRLLRNSTSCVSQTKKMILLFGKKWRAQHSSDVDFDRG